MRWQELFADLEGQARSLEAADRDSEIADRTRAEVGRVQLVNRLRAQQAEVLTLHVQGTGAVRGLLERVGRDWLLVSGVASGSREAEAVIPLDAITAVSDLPFVAVAPEGVSVIGSRVGLTAALRALVRDRSPVVVRLREGAPFVGTLSRAGADFVDIALHDSDMAPRLSSVRAHATVAFRAVAMVQRQLNGSDQVSLRS